MERESGVLVRILDEESVDRPWNGERRMLLEFEERLRLDGGTTRIEGLVLLRTGVLREG